MRVETESRHGKNAGLTLRCVRDSEAQLSSNFCNNFTPGWGADGLGTVTWGSTSNTDINSGTSIVSGIGGRPTQVWSGHVFASACAKGNATNSNQFNGGFFRDFSADCRQSLSTFNFGRDERSITGDFFSWCAVYRFQNKFCPYPWRVPTRQDFDVLIQNLNRNSEHFTGVSGTAELPEIGGVWGGVRFAGSPQFLTNSASVYWSSTTSGISAPALFSSWTPPSQPLTYSGKDRGNVLRCIKDVVDAERPTITEHPQSANYAQYDMPNILTVTAGISNGGTLTYQWFTSTSLSDQNGVAIDGATTASFTPSTETLGTFYFFVVVSNSIDDNGDGGNKVVSIASNVARIRVTLPLLPNGCNQNMPGWGNSLGAVSFHSNNEWIIGNQIWSDAVTATACQKTSFNAGSANNYSADCRSNPGQRGDFFSACAVIRFANYLCPAPWRVPTREDFLKLNIAMGGVGDGVRYQSMAILNNYRNIWGGTFSGWTDWFRPEHQGLNANYWMLLNDDAISRFGYCHAGWISFGGTILKHNFGYALRCVRGL